MTTRRAVLGAVFVALTWFMIGWIGLLFAAVGLTLWVLGRWSPRLLWAASVLLFAVAAASEMARSRSPSVVSLNAASQHLLAHDVAGFALSLVAFAALIEVTQARISNTGARSLTWLGSLRRWLASAEPGTEAEDRSQEDEGTP
jgi:hypothetical protein